MKVLIVDDHVLFREGLVSLLKSQPDFEVVGQAGTVQETLAQVSLVCPDLILMDFSLPDGTGLDATRAILAEHPGIKIVFLTVYETDDKLLAAIRGGARGYLLKNVPIARLLAALRSVEKGEAALSRAMTSRLMEEFARTAGGKPGPPDGFERLSRREMEVLRYARQHGLK
jgi:DNA-binding NarL/FixJ family response regulator